MSIDSQWHHGGHLRLLAKRAGCEVHEILDFSSNMNPMGPPDWLRPEIDAHIENVLHYPDPHCELLTETAARRFGLDAKTIVWGNGASDLLFALPRILSGGLALVPQPCYTDYERALTGAGLTVQPFRMEESEGFHLDIEKLGRQLGSAALVLLARPNNPTGLLASKDALTQLIVDHPRVIFVVDEAFIDFLDDDESLVANQLPNLVVLRSLTKFFCIPGLRLGFLTAAPKLASRLREHLASWSVNTLAQAIGVRGLQDWEFSKKSRMYTREARVRFVDELNKFPELAIYPGTANFLFMALKRGTASALAERLLRYKIAIRTYPTSYLDDRFFRVAVRNHDDNQILLDALRNHWQSSPTIKRKHKPALMFQGSGSNVGKSIMAVAMCRVLFQDGYDVAPFKAQNMSLNAFVTRDGKEMARAQALQAQACRLSPDWRMNPLLLKPSGSMESQVIYRGEPLGNQAYDHYRQSYDELKQGVCETYDSLADEHEVLVLEGAGSPGEVNLKDRDLVNMAMAAHAQAPVILVGDIDRGGVFASFMGTMNVLAEWERRLVAGFLINRFRGEKSLLRDALDYLSRYTRRDTLGVMPFLTDLGLPEEDSVGFRQNVRFQSMPASEQLDIAIVDLPHIANFTDFDPFSIEPEVNLRLVRSLAQLNQPDVLILPGSKSVIRDLSWLRQSGLADEMVRLARNRKVEIIGLCGGMQMLGDNLFDPNRVESLQSSVAGLGFLPITTRWDVAKQTRQVNVTHLISRLPVVGYEIHHGQTDWGSATGLFANEGHIYGARHPQCETWWGTYIHGLFENDAFRRWWIDRARLRLNPLSPPLPLRSYNLEPQFDRLAEVFREHVKVKELYRIMGLR